MSWQEHIGKNLIKNVEVTIGDNKTTVDNIDGKLKIEHYYKDTLQKTENEMENKYGYLDKQTYTERELIQNLEAINKHPECITETHKTINWNDLTYTTIIDIIDHVYEDYITGGQDGYCYFSVIYNNIIVFIENDSDISSPNIQFKYVPSQIDECDLNTIKKTFNFLNKEMYQD
jgi:hypothetical protein